MDVFPPLEFFGVVWRQVLVFLWIFGKICLWSHLAQNLFSGSFLITASVSLVLLIYSGFLILPDWVWEDCTFLETCPFHPSCLIFWHIVGHSIFLQSFVFLWCWLLFCLFHFWFYWFDFSLFVFWWVLLKFWNIYYIPTIHWNIKC